MVLENARKALKDFLGNINVDFIYEMEDDYLMITANKVTLGRLDDDISIRIGVFKNDSFFIELIFDRINDLAVGLPMVNQLNIEIPWIKTYVNEKGYLVFHHSNMFLFDEQSLVDTVGFVLGFVSNDDFIQKIKPICAITE